MKYLNTLEIIKLILGIILISFPISGGVIFFLEGFQISFYILDSDSLSNTIWENNSPTFLGLCGISGSILLNSIKTDIK